MKNSDSSSDDSSNREEKVSLKDKELEQPESQNPEEMKKKEEPDWKNQALRSMAELENYRKRISREMDEYRLRANEVLLSDLLPIVDNFEMGMSELDKLDKKDNVFQGLEMVRNQLKSLLESHQVKEIVPNEGEEFDSLLHEAVSQEVSEVPEGKIIRFIRCGYSLGEHLLRPALVVTSLGNVEKEEKEDSSV